jgi:hypothetical protein
MSRRRDSMTPGDVSTHDDQRLPMSHTEPWRFLSGRIQGLLRAGELHARFQSVRSSDGYGRGARLREQMERIVAALKSFREAYQDSLPPAATAAVDEFLARTEGLIADTSSSPDSREERVWAALVMWGAFETEMSFLLADVQEMIRTRTARAFEHLQRSIVADPDIRRKWQAAFAAGETACEALGAVQLLSHGIWAFKVNAAGERTDLVYRDGAPDTARMQAVADGLVLTEWKKAADGADASALFESALMQAELYAQGALGGIELTRYRYLVLVSGKRVPEPGDRQTNSTLYRHVNIAVDPDSPSRESARAVAPRRGKSSGKKK